MLTFSEFSTLEDQFRKNLINSVTGFKSVTLIGTQNADGLTNLAIFSQVIHVGANPPLIGVLFRPHVVKRHTLENILSTEFFTLNHIPESHVTPAHHTSARWDRSEFEACQFSPMYQSGFFAPFVSECPIKIGLKLVEKIDVKANGTHLVIGEVQQLYLPDNILGADGFVDLEAAGIVTCSGLDSYHRTQSIARLSYAKPDRTPVKVN